MNKNITNHPSVLDINEIWAAIEPQVDKINAERKKRKPGFIYWLSGLALLAGLGITSFLIFSDSTQNINTQKESLPNPSSKSVVPIITNESNKAIDINSATTKVSEVNEIKSVTTTLSNIVSDENDNREPKTITVEKRFKETLPTAPSTKVITPTKPNSFSVSNNVVSDSQTSTVLPIQKEFEKMSDVVEAKIGLTAPSILTTSSINFKNPKTDLPALNFSIKNNKSLVPPPPYKRGIDFSIEFQTGISATNRTLSSENRNLDSLLLLRNTFEETLETLHANLLVNAHFPSGFYVSSGVAFTQISEVYTNNSTQTDSIIDPMGIQKRVIISPGDTIDIIGPVVSSVTTTTFSKKFYNTYRMIDIPVFVGYQYDFGDWKTDFSVGVFANILLATDGRIPSSPTTDLDLSTNGKDVYRSRVDFSLQFGIGVSKSLTEKLSLRVNPNFRYYSKNFINESFGLSQRYLLFGGTVGLRLDL